jgi:hypothetical protein
LIIPEPEHAVQTAGVLVYAFLRQVQPRVGARPPPMLVQAAWPAIKTQGRLQARYHKLVRRFGGPKNRGAVKKAILGIARTLLKIAYEVLSSGKPYQDPGPIGWTDRARSTKDPGRIMKDARRMTWRSCELGCC